MPLFYLDDFKIIAASALAPQGHELQKAAQTFLEGRPYLQNAASSAPPAPLTGRCHISPAQLEFSISSAADKLLAFAVTPEMLGFDDYLAVNEHGFLQLSNPHSLRPILRDLFTTMEQNGLTCEDDHIAGKGLRILIAEWIKLCPPQPSLPASLKRSARLSASDPA